MHDTSALIEARIIRFHQQRILPAVHTHEQPMQVAAWAAPGEPVPFHEAVSREFTPLNEGDAWGQPWGTTWLRISGTVPSDWPGDARRELVVNLGWKPGAPGFQSEGLCYTPDGSIIKALEPRNSWIPIDASSGAEFTVYVEAASNPDIGGVWGFLPTDLGDPQTAPARPLYTFGGARLTQLDETMWGLERDVWTLLDVMAQLPQTSPRRAGILRALERAIDILDPQDVPARAKDARLSLVDTLSRPAGATSHRVVAVGHAHIDSAWLWPTRETKRKVARTFSNVVDLMDRYPDFTFAASSAQQYAWLKADYPEVFERVRARIADGRFVPVGGMWVESDTNMPGGEAMARQFVLGKEFFLREFGVETDEVWLPDSFGYSAGLPQIVTASNSSNFLTQKISWNETDTMPHHTFLWEGIDGTQVFTHFPPVDTYNSELTAVELNRAESQHAERGLSDLSLVPFGFGDGGGGPTREMLEVALRKADLEGSPQVRLGRPDEFFASAAAELTEPAVWVGELYLEFHRGTYTSQARTKFGNRRSEHLLREAELWAATAAVRTEYVYPADELRECWEIVLLQQFHDILPGSSIAWVHQEAERNYAAVAGRLGQVIDDALHTLDTAQVASSQIVANAAPIVQEGVTALGAAPSTPQPSRISSDGGYTVLETDYFTARVDGRGHLVSLVDHGSQREVIPPGQSGNQLLMFHDIPNQWDAWDIDKSYQQTPLAALDAADAPTVKGDALQVRYLTGNSTVSQRLCASPDGRALDIETTVDWHEQQKLLKLGFPIDVHTSEAAFEVQFGHIRRPTHTNTSWDSARFEVSGHRWVRVEEPGFGVTLANDRVYGRDVTRHVREGGGTYSLIRESLLRAPRFPDPHADQGEHVFRHSLRVGSLLDGVAEGYRLNLPLRPTAGPIEPLVRIDGSPAVIIEAVKLAQDGSGDVIVRLYEAAGGRASARLVPTFDPGAASRTDLLERPWPEQPDDALRLDLRPFELVTIRIARA
ncbi:glycoside hydrolase family 38 C-terminal domain-containing protein [Branchiibius sp. NY16-3462-2]|uniref:alpha-mannosidase n=1 Tax=Branchiibius sp. NY16-3462-2 TaxID=1807500 RepID=UPI00079662DA|nr:glycoside hydrolase family 38 C-terminal domain-containing protein [Branchiibius sp. NY16-3462-2]KYH44673.1 alpha-mannosidase [Branchiibius sp. NY16-3462-2]